MCEVKVCSSFIFLPVAPLPFLSRLESGRAETRRAPARRGHAWGEARVAQSTATILFPGARASLSRSLSWRPIDHLNRESFAGGKEFTTGWGTLVLHTLALRKEQKKALN